MDRRKFIFSSSLATSFFFHPEISLNKFPGNVGKAKLKLSLNAYSFNGLLRSGEMDLFQLLDFCASQNLDAIDPTGYYFPNYPNRPDSEYINKFKRKAHLLGLDISGTGTRNDFTNPDKEKRKTDVQHVKEWIEIAAELGSPLLRVFPGKEVPTNIERKVSDQWLAECLYETCEYGKQHGVMISMQNHNEYIKTADQIVAIMNLVNHDWLRLHLDIGSLRQGDPYQEIEKVVKYANTWQIKELVYVNQLPQKTDLLKVFQIATDAGYRGYLPLETLGEGDPYKKVTLLIDQAKSALAKIAI